MISKLRRLIAWTFSVCAWIGGMVGTALFFTFGSDNRAAEQPWTSVQLFMVGFSAVSALVFLAAYWTSSRRYRSARILGVAASLTYLAAGAFAFAGSSHTHVDGAVTVGAGLALLGVLGCVAFLSRANDAPPPKAKVEPRIPGDGTSALSEFFFGLFAAGGIYVGAHWWLGRAERLHLPWNLPFLFLVASFVGAMLLHIAVHETGHALAARLEGMRLRLFLVGPFQWHLRDRRWSFTLAWRSPFGGAVMAAPTILPQLQARLLRFILAGPAASLLLGLVALFAALPLRSAAIAPFAIFLAMLATVGLVSGFGNLIPVRTARAYSDGAQIYQLLRNGPLADYIRAIFRFSASTVSPMRPRDCDLAELERAASVLKAGRRAVALRLVEYSILLDREQTGPALAALHAADALCFPPTVQPPANPPARPPAPPSAEICPAFVFGFAFLEHDAVLARLWQDRADAAPPKHLHYSYWIGLSALLLCEGKASEASTAWQTGQALALQAPDCGALQCDAEWHARLREKIDAAVAGGPLSGALPSGALDLATVAM